MKPSVGLGLTFVGAGLALLVWGWQLSTEATPAPLQAELIVPAKVRVELNVNRAPHINEQAMPILRRTSYSEIAAGRYANYTGVVIYSAGAGGDMITRSFVYWLNNGDGEFVTAKMVLPGFGNAFYVRPSYRDGVVTFDPVRDWLFISVLILGGVALMFGGALAIIGWFRQDQNGLAA